MGSLGNFQEAIMNFNKAIELNPKFMEAYGNRAIARYSVKDMTGAIEDCEKVLERNPNDQTAIQLKARVQQELQNRNK